MATYEIRPFSGAEAEIIASWAATEDDRNNLTGGEGTVNQQSVALWRMEANWAFTLRENGDLVAYGDLLEDDVEQDVEIVHVVVAPDRRGRGNCKALLSRLCVFLEGACPYKEVWLRAPRSLEPLQKAAASVGTHGRSGKIRATVSVAKKNCLILPPEIAR